MPTRQQIPVLLPERLRRPPRSFAWVDHRLRSSGLLPMLEPEAIGLYLFLILAADREGLSCWRLDRIQGEIPCFDRSALWQARDRLCTLDLIAFKPWRKTDPDGVYQVLSLKRTGVPLSPKMNTAFSKLARRLQGGTSEE